MGDRTISGDDAFAARSISCTSAAGDKYQIREYLYITVYRTEASIIISTFVFHIFQLPFEVVVYWVQHLLIVSIPFFLLSSKGK